ncbi:MAG: flagellar motor switch protein FliG [Rhodobacteraceae bacterium]|nr:MAG: flagellar motor switch protein FliG [Paracoccaceae bacterium]
MTLPTRSNPLPALSGPGDMSPALRRPQPLGRRAKAAVIVRLLLSEGADIPIEDLPEDLQAALTAQMGRMGLVDRDTLQQVVAEFADELDAVGLSFPRGLAGALSILDGRISAQTAARLRREAGVRQAGDPWIRIRDASVEDLARLAQSESIEIAAVMLSKLETGKAAELLGKIPGPLARRITYAVSLTGNVAPDAVDRIGLSLAARLDAKPPRAFEADPSERVGEILNFSAALTRDDVLTGLDETDADFAGEVRKSLFTFAHIPTRVAARDLPRVLREVQQPVLVTALAHAKTSPETAPTVDFVLASISSRLSDNLREEIGDRGKVRPADGEEALIQIVAAVRRLEQAGEIRLIRPEDVAEDG